MKGKEQEGDELEEEKMKRRENEKKGTRDRRERRVRMKGYTEKRRGKRGSI